MTLCQRHVCTRGLYTCCAKLPSVSSCDRLIGELFRLIGCGEFCLLGLAQQIIRTLEVTSIDLGFCLFDQLLSYGIFRA